ELNQRIIAALSGATHEHHGDKPDAWWIWWNEYNEIFLEGEKQWVTGVVNREVAIVDRPVLPPPMPRANNNPSPPPAETTKPSGSEKIVDDRPIRTRGSINGTNIGTTNDVGSFRNPTGAPLTATQQSYMNLGFAPVGLDCLAAGTPVWTSAGQIAVERVQVGDLVLSQNIETGELTYKPVLKTTVRPAGQLVRIEAGYDEHIETSGGHPFWVSGAGWVKARELKSGMLLHTPTQSLAISRVEQGAHAKTYNLVVADFHTYFAGEMRLLSHDNTVRRSTDILVPGLATAPAAR
ncbi:MAG TPA: polymorphic toxin-type HINT domain-containing protein, partial [Pirellulaceae bacterium]|nr:polymorphic toxin-type HINT domain-containing protein [Pirellulaceae bacterium]